METKPWQIQLPSRKLEVELTTVSSNYHVEMNPSDVGNNDRYVVQEIIKVRRLSLQRCPRAPLAQNWLRRRPNSAAGVHRRWRAAGR